MFNKLTFKNDTQRIMFEVIISLLPAVLYKVYSFAWFGLFSLSTLLVTAFITEKILAKILNIKSNLADYSSIITAILLFLALNCNMTFFIYFIASFTAVGLGKMVYGGFAKNIFNPAMVGWCFVMISFPQFMTKHLDYSAIVNFNESLNIFLGTLSIDSYTSATPLDEYKPFHLLLLEIPAIFNLNMLILAGGCYLLARKIISPVFPIALSLGVVVALVAFSFKFIEATTLFFLYGPIILAGFYIVTDPVSSPSLPKAQFVFSFFVGFIAILIAKYGTYPIGIAFAVVFMNSFNFILDQLFNKGKLRNGTK